MLCYFSYRVTGGQGDGLQYDSKLGKKIGAPLDNNPPPLGIYGTPSVKIVLKLYKVTIFVYKSVIFV